MKWFFLGLAGIIIGLILHIVSLLAIPALAPRDAYSRIADMGETNTFIQLSLLDENRSLPFLDPAFAYLACRFDVAESPVRIQVPLNSPYVSMSFHDREGRAFFSLNDRSALGTILDVEIRDQDDEDAKALPLGAGTISVTAPGPTGFVLTRMLIEAPSMAKSITESLPNAVCSPRR